MPTLTRWFLKTSLVHLSAALIIGLLLAIAPTDIVAVPIGIGPLYFHLFLVGWVAQLIFGIVFWLFPKYSKEQPRGFTWLGWTTYLLLNLGLILRVFGEPANAARPGQIWGWLLTVSAVLQWLAGLAFVINTWPRVHGGPRRRRKKAA